jgi:hypothetical protein
MAPPALSYGRDRAAIHHEGTKATKDSSACSVSSHAAMERSGHAAGFASFASLRMTPGGVESRRWIARAGGAAMRRHEAQGV